MVTQVNKKAVKFSESESIKKAQLIGQKVAYNFEFVKAHGNITKKLTFSPKYEKQYNITISNGTTAVSHGSGNIIFPTRYQGPSYELNTSETYTITYNEGFKLE